MLLLSEKAASGSGTGGGFHIALFAAGLVALIVGYVELRVPMPVGAQGGDAVYNTVRTAIPIEPQYLGSGIPAMWTFLRGDGVWAGVSPPTAVSWRSALLDTTSTSFVTTGLTITLDLPAATSDVLLNARIYQEVSCTGRIRTATTTLQEGISRIEESFLDYTIVHTDPGIGSHTYVFEAKFNSPGTDCEINAGHRGISVLIGQVLR